MKKEIIYFSPLLKEYGIESLLPLATSFHDTRNSDESLKVYQYGDINEFA